MIDGLQAMDKAALISEVLALRQQMTAAEQELARARDNEQRRAALFLSVQKKADRLETANGMHESMLDDAKMLVGGMAIELFRDAKARSREGPR